jgi:hypothetical protein
MKKTHYQVSQIKKIPLKITLLGIILNSTFDTSQPISYNGIEITESMNHEITLELLKELDNLKIKKYSDALFFGQVHPKTSKREGKGIMKYKNGRVYEGEFYNDLRQGDGYELYPNNNTYIGGFYEGKAHGSGIYKWNNGEVYDGEWKHGLKNGNGMWKGGNGDSYIGEWTDSRADGYGVHIWSNGDRYEGEWKI